jgi:hypothetical protein
MMTQGAGGIDAGDRRRLEAEPLRTMVYHLFAAADPADGPEVLGIEVLEAIDTAPTPLRVLATLRSPVSHTIMRVPLHLPAAQRVG